MNFICNKNKLYQAIKEAFTNGSIYGLDERINEMLENNDMIKKLIKKLSSYVEFVIKTETSVISANQKKDIKRGNVYWIEFEGNPGTEFSGRHPGIILQYNKQAEQVYVVPVNSEKKQYNDKPWCVRIPAIEKFEEMKRWVNVLNAKFLSIKRIDFKSTIGKITDTVLYQIDKAISKYQYQPQI